MYVSLYVKYVPMMRCKFHRVIAVHHVHYLLCVVSIDIVDLLIGIKLAQYNLYISALFITSEGESLFTFEISNLLRLSITH